MKVWTNTTFEGVVIQGVAVVVANTAEQAAELLNTELFNRKLLTAFPTDHRRVLPSQMVQVKTNASQCIILSDGDY